MLRGEDVSFNKSFKLIEEQRNLLERTFRDYNEAFDKMNQLFEKPTRSIDEDGTMNEEFVKYFSKESIHYRSNSVRECRWQAERVIEDASKLYADSEKCLLRRLRFHPVQRALFLKEEEKEKVELHKIYSENLIHSACEILNKYVSN